MCPRIIGDNRPNSRIANTVLATKSGLRHVARFVQSAYLLYLNFGQLVSTGAFTSGNPMRHLSHTTTIPARHPALSSSILRVFLSGAEKHMSRIAARRIVAAVANKQFKRIESVNDLKYQTVYKVDLAFLCGRDTDAAVMRNSAACPYPATVQMVGSEPLRYAMNVLCGKVGKWSNDIRHFGLLDRSRCWAVGVLQRLNGPLIIAREV